MKATHRLETIFCGCSICPKKRGKKRSLWGPFCIIELSFSFWLGSWGSRRVRVFLPGGRLAELPECLRSSLMTIFPCPPSCLSRLSVGWIYCFNLSISIMFPSSGCFPISLRCLLLFLTSLFSPFPTCFLSLVTLTPSSPAPSHPLAPAPSLSWPVTRSGT